ERRVGGVPAGGHDSGIPLADPQLRAGRLLQRAQAAGVVGVRVRVEQHLHIADVEAELRDARHDRRRALRIAAVDQYVARRPGEQERGDAGRPDVVEVARDAERLVGLRTGPLDRRPPEQAERHDDGGRRPQQHEEPASLEWVPHLLAFGLGPSTKYLTLQSMPRRQPGQGVFVPGAAGAGFPCVSSTPVLATVRAPLRQGNARHRPGVRFSVDAETDDDQSTATPMDERLRALNRFGLGARPGERGRVGDARDWLTGQLGGGPPQLAAVPVTGAEISDALVALRRAGAGGTDQERAEARRRLTRIAGAEQRAALTERMRSERPFVERLVAFW